MANTGGILPYTGSQGPLFFPCVHGYHCRLVYFIADLDLFSLPDLRFFIPDLRFRSHARLARASCLPLRPPRDILCSSAKAGYTLVIAHPGQTSGAQSFLRTAPPSNAFPKSAEALPQ